MRYRRLGYFVAVAEELSFTRAAERLHMAQPPLSQQIAQLEKELGTGLFDRSRRTIQLTAAGSALLPEARRLLSELDETARMVRRIGEGAVGRLAVGFVPSAVNGDLPDILREFALVHPGVELMLREMAPDPLLAAVLDRQLDLGVLYRPIADSLLHQRQLSSERLLLALPDGHPASRSDEVALSDVADEAFILLEQHDVPGIHAAVTTTFAEAGITPKIAQRRVWQIQTALALVAAGMGLAIVPESVEAVRRRGVTLRAVHGSQRLELAAVWRPDNDLSPLAGLLTAIERAIAG